MWFRLFPPVLISPPAHIRSSQREGRQVKLRFDLIAGNKRPALFASIFFVEFSAESGALWNVTSLFHLCICKGAFLQDEGLSLNFRVTLSNSEIITIHKLHANVDRCQECLMRQVRNLCMHNKATNTLGMCQTKVRCLCRSQIVFWKAIFLTELLPIMGSSIFSRSTALSFP